MKKTAMLALVGVTISTIGFTQVQAEGLRERLAAKRAGTDVSTPVAQGGQTITYGTDPLQTLDLWRARGVRGPAPLVLFVHGGGWSKGNKNNATGKWMVPHYTGAGYAFASIDYRLVPAATVEQQASDVAAAIRVLLDRAPQLGIDRNRVVIMGHSAGAHLVALVGTDERYLKTVGLSFADLDGVIPIDGAAYDVPAQMRQAGPKMKRTYRQAFGTEPERQRALSPTLQAAAPNAPSFLLPHVQREDGVKQSEALAAALNRAGTSAKTASFPGDGLQGHMEINRRMGDPDYAATPVVDGWLGHIFDE